MADLLVPPPTMSPGAQPAVEAKVTGRVRSITEASLAAVGMCAVGDLSEEIRVAARAAAQVGWSDNRSTTTISGHRPDGAGVR